jgi:hypothetical protein
MFKLALVCFQSCVNITENKLTNLQEFYHRYGDARHDIIYRLGNVLVYV